MYIHSTTHLFDGLSFQEALGMYWRMIELARKVEGPVPNHDAFWVSQHREGEFFHTSAIKRRDKIHELDGYLVEEFPFGDFFIEKGNGTCEFRLTREKLFPQSWERRECIAQVAVSDAKSAADVAEAVIGYVMQVELVSIAEAALQGAEFEVSVQDVTKLGGYLGIVRPLSEALKTQQKFEDAAQSLARGNAITSSTIGSRYGYFGIPAFGKARFIPTKKVEMDEQTFEEIRGRYAREQEEIRELWGAIALQTHKHRFDFQTCNFAFEGKSYTVSHNPSHMGDPACSGIAIGYVGGGTMDLLSALRSGLLKAWAEWVSEAAVAA